MVEKKEKYSNKREAHNIDYGFRRKSGGKHSQAMNYNDYTIMQLYGGSKANPGSPGKWPLKRRERDIQGSNSIPR